jgi:hypothetical protein
MFYCCKSGLRQRWLFSFNVAIQVVGFVMPHAACSEAIRHRHQWHALDVEVQLCSRRYDF